MKKEYMKPAMSVVRIKQQHIICTSSGSYNGQSIKMQSGSIDDEDYVW
jgi:hypothetical protein